MRFLNNVTVPKNVKGGTLWDFLTSIVLQIIKKLKKRHFGGIQKLQKKSHSAEKNPSKKNEGGSYVIDVLDIDVFVVDEVLAFRVCFGRPYFKLMMLNK